MIRHISHSICCHYDIIAFAMILECDQLVFGKLDSQSVLDQYDIVYPTTWGLEVSRVSIRDKHNMPAFLLA